ncbi:cytochrome c oxidase assembly protein [Histidinibacterium aquaticum]|uniref:Cytochrome c oxidase assembly protein n=1 Tax=Histidinibacterium aquaticum TaxID=2613962 RepID=A0A5J5GFP4_9RHOB|nr:cytochrome c oxidase assembly protein [Histidinibacterium aquaticum]KAA9006951.1 cytochrome c oxidase assembly protein [Histidinibacterium aquaticum]
MEYVPFCGTPPAPVELLTRWTFDPALLLGLAAFLVVGLWTAHRRGRFLVGWGLTVLLFVSPLCALSMALFSARVGQHLLLTLVVAPLIASSVPLPRLTPLVTAAFFAALFWVWHAPAPYAGTLASDLTYWSMHLSLFISSVLFWRSLGADRPFESFLAAAFTAAQMTAYSVLLVLSPEPWHAWHELTTAPYGMSALGDQALAGGLMWVVGGLLFVGTIGLAVARYANRQTPVGS